MPHPVLIEFALDVSLETSFSVSVRIYLGTRMFRVGFTVEDGHKRCAVVSWCCITRAYCCELIERGSRSYP